LACPATAAPKFIISNCGGKLCGKVVWLQEPVDSKTGKPKTDAPQSDPAKHPGQ